MESLFSFCEARVARNYHYLFNIEIVTELVSRDHDIFTKK